MIPLSPREQKRLMDAWCDSSEYRAYRASRINPALRIPLIKRSGYTVNSYRSGEITGAQFHTGYESCFAPPSRVGPLVTDKLSRSGKTKIRRAIQNSPVDFVCLMTVTFDPSVSHHSGIIPGCSGSISPLLLPGNTVSHTWAKDKFKRFINSIKVSCDRRSKVSGDASKRLAYVWVAELQASGNIHFHVLLNHRLPIVWLTHLWGQAANSIDVRPVQNQNHAGCYLRKYISKGVARIEGNRYGISQNLREAMKPMKTSTDNKKESEAIKEIIDALKEDIEKNGGAVIDCGFFVPPPTRSVPYRKKGKIRKTKAVSGELAPFIKREVLDIVDPIPF